MIKKENNNSWPWYKSSLCTKQIQICKQRKPLSMDVLDEFRSCFALFFNKTTLAFWENSSFSSIRRDWVIGYMKLCWILKILNISVSPDYSSSLFVANLISSLSNYWSDFCIYSFVFSIGHIAWILLYVAFSDWHLSLSNMHLNFLHVWQLIFYCWKIFHCMNIPPFIHSSTEGYLGAK